MNVRWFPCWSLSLPTVCRIDTVPTVRPTSPTKPEGLAAAQSGCGQQVPQRPEPVLVPCAQEASELLGGPGVEGLALRLGLLRVGGSARTVGETASRPPSTASRKAADSVLWTWRGASEIEPSPRRPRRVVRVRATWCLPWASRTGRGNAGELSITTGITGAFQQCGRPLWQVTP
jgi:hypothetical protein